MRPVKIKIEATIRFNRVAVNSCTSTHTHEPVLSLDELQTTLSQTEEVVREPGLPAENATAYYQRPNTIRQWAKTVQDQSDDMSLFCSAVEAQPFTSTLFRRDPFRTEPCKTEFDGDEVVTTLISEYDLPGSTMTLSLSIPDAQPVTVTSGSLNVSNKENINADNCDHSMSFDEESDDIDDLTERQGQARSETGNDIFAGLCGYDDMTLRELHDWSLRHALPAESLEELKGILQREVFMGVVNGVLEELETVWE